MIRTFKRGIVLPAMLLCVLSCMYAAITDGARKLDQSYTEYEAVKDIPEEVLLGKKEVPVVYYDSDDFKLQELRESKLYKVAGYSSRIRKPHDKSYSSENKGSHRDLTDFAKLHKQKYVFVSNEAFSYEVYLLRPYSQAEMAAWKFGIESQDFSEDELEEGLTGAYVYAAFHGYPAFNSGVRAGDIIVRLNGTDIAGADDLSKFEASAQKGDVIKASIIRNGEEITLDIKL